MAKCNALNCQEEGVGRVEASDISLLLCEWHTYEYEHDLGWLGKEEEEATKHTFPPIERPDDL